MIPVGIRACNPLLVNLSNEQSLNEVSLSSLTEPDAGSDAATFLTHELS